MTRKTCLCFAVAAIFALAVATDAQAFWGSRGGWGSGGSSGGSGGSGGSWGSGGSHGGGFLSRIFDGRGSRGSHGSNGGHSSCGSHGGHASGGSNGGYASGGSNGGYASYSSGGHYASSQPTTTFAVAPAPAVKTQLTLRVPAGAKVTLAGVPTKQTGEFRQFTTTKLANGQAWQNYQVVVEMDNNGKMVREERTITLTGGQPQALSIGIADATTLAQATR